MITIAAYSGLALTLRQHQPETDNLSKSTISNFHLIKKFLLDQRCKVPVKIVFLIKTVIPAYSVQTKKILGLKMPGLNK